MMKHFWTIWKTQLNQTFGISHLRYLYRRNRRSFTRRIAFVPLILLAVLPALQVITSLYRTMFQVLHPLGQDAVVFALAFVFAQSLSLVFGLFYLMSNFYFAKDLGMLIPLPVKPSVILGSKFMTVVVSEYIITLPIVLPALLVYGQSVPPWYFWPMAFLITLLLPIIPLAMASIFVILLMRMTNVSKGRGLMRVLGAFLGVLFYSGIQWFQLRFRHSGPQQLNQLFTSPNGLTGVVTRKFPPSLWAAEGLLNFPKFAGILYILLYLAATTGAMIFLFILADRFFYKGLIGGNEVSAKRKKIVTSAKTFVARSSFQALFLREWRNLTRSASFLMPVLVNIVILPIAFIVPAVSANSGWFSIGMIQSNAMAREIVVFAVAGLIILVSTANSIAGTALSREGNSFWISKIIPVPAFVQVLSKLSLTFLIPLFFTVVAVLVELLILGFGFTEVTAQVFLALSGSVLTNSFGLFIDLLHPKLDWTDPQHVMKRNLNITIVTFSTFGFAAFSGILAFFLVTKAGFTPFLTYFTITGLWLVLDAIVIMLLYKKAESYYRRINL